MIHEARICLLALLLSLAPDPRFDINELHEMKSHGRRCIIIVMVSECILKPRSEFTYHWLCR